MIKLSLVVSAYNEEDNILECLKSAEGVADEIIVVSGSSTDSTERIAKKFGATIFSQPNHPMLNRNKNYGFEKAKGEWILNLDADERLTPALRDEIKATLSSKSDVNGYWIPRKNIIFGKWIESAMWWPDYQLRLFRKTKGRFREKHVHEYLSVDGKTDKLSEPMIHENYTSISQYLRKMDVIYTENEAFQILSSGKTLTWIDAIRLPVNDFLKTFFLQKGYKDGLHGLILSILQAFYAEVVFAKVWEKQGFPPYDDRNFLADIHKEFKKVRYQFRYWILTGLMENTTNIIKKNLFRVLRKHTRNKLKE